MTVKEKVDQLVEDFYNFMFNVELYNDQIIDCCDKVADEVIKETSELERLTFWKQVKDELWLRRKKK
jgi:hypothetical protein